MDEALGQNLSRLMAEGPAEELTLTENAQPAIMANALATLRASGIDLQAKADFVAGHSLGEYSALCAAGHLRSRHHRAPAEAARPGDAGGGAGGRGGDGRLARRRSRHRPGGRDAAAQGEVCTVANDNDPSQVVISGHRGAIERALEIAKEKGAKRAILLPVSAPFHCPLMQPAADAMAEALAGAAMEPPAVSLYANVTAAPVDSPDTIRELLVEQVTGMVRWRESVANMAAAGVTHFVEFGGKVLGPMVKRIAPDVEVTSVVSMEDIDALVEAI